MLTSIHGKSGSTTLPCMLVNISSELGNIHSWEHAAGNDEALNLGSTFKDVEYLRITEPLVKKQLALRALTRGRDAYPCGSHLHEQAACIGFAHRCLFRVGNTLIRHPGRTPDQETRHLQLLSQVLQLLFDLSALLGRIASGQLLLHPLTGAFVSSAGNTNGQSANHWTCSIE